MDDETSVSDAMQVVNERLPSLATSPRVDEFQTELALDSNGEPATFITVIVEDDPSGEPYPWTRLKPIHDLVWVVFTERAVPRKPYIDFRLRSEAGGDQDEADAES